MDHPSRDDGTDVVSSPDPDPAEQLEASTDAVVSHTNASSDTADEVRDELPDDLVAHGYVGPYQFPDNSRRRIPGIMYLVLAVICAVVWLVWSDTSTAVNGGFLAAAVLLGATGAMHLGSGWRMNVDESQALAAAAGSVGFAVGHASAQQVWRGVRSRPTWRVLCYSADDPPSKRALVLVDAIDASVVESLVEDNPELDALDTTSSGSRDPETVPEV